jgi:dolichol-phosphate mannosyltransferase
MTQAGRNDDDTTPSQVRLCQMRPAMKYDLALVMPVYNEGACIYRAVSSWRAALECVGIRYRMIILNDGSIDSTPSELDKFRVDPVIEIIHQANVGHGPTILRGYRLAVGLAEWVFQCDSDNEISPSYFSVFWQNRKEHDAVFGTRQYVHRTTGRKIISLAATITTCLLSARWHRDVNVPYRLIRSRILGELISQIPPNTFAPNVIISAAILRSRLNTKEIPVICEGRKTGIVSIARFRLWQSAARSLLQTLACRPRLADRDR